MENRFAWTFTLRANSNGLLLPGLRHCVPRTDRLLALQSGPTPPNSGQASGVLFELDGEDPKRPETALSPRTSSRGKSKTFLKASLPKTAIRECPVAGIPSTVTVRAPEKQRMAGNPQKQGAKKDKRPPLAWEPCLTGGVRGIRTLDEALHPILP